MVRFGILSAARAEEDQTNTPRDFSGGIVRPAKPLDLQTVVRTFEAIPELVTAGAFGGANALYLEHIENPFERFSLDIDLQNQSEEIESVHHRLSVHKGQREIDWLRLLARASRASDNDYNPSQ